MSERDLRTAAGQPLKPASYWDGGGQHTLTNFGCAGKTSVIDLSPGAGRESIAFATELDGQAPAEHDPDTFAAGRPGLATIRTKVHSQSYGKSDFLAQGRRPFVEPPRWQRGLALFSHGVDPHDLDKDRVTGRFQPGGKHPPALDANWRAKVSPQLAARAAHMRYVRAGNVLADDEPRTGQTDATDWWHKSKRLCFSEIRKPPWQPSQDEKCMRFEGLHRLPPTEPKERVFNKEYNGFSWGVPSRGMRGPAKRSWFYENSCSPFGR